MDWAEKYFDGLERWLPRLVMVLIMLPLIVFGISVRVVFEGFMRGWSLADNLFEYYARIKK